jgi:hypothetical protein
MCETKPNLERMGYLGKRTLHAERFGDVAGSAKQSQLPISEQGHRQAALADATPKPPGDSVKQTQLEEQVSSLKCEVSSGVAVLQTSNIKLDTSCETKPICPAGLYTLTGAEGVVPRASRPCVPPASCQRFGGGTPSTQEHRGKMPSLQGDKRGRSPYGLRRGPESGTDRRRHPGNAPGRYLVDNPGLGAVGWVAGLILNPQRVDRLRTCHTI